MKRGPQIFTGVYGYSTGQIGTADLPVFIAEVCLGPDMKKPKVVKHSKKHTYFLNHIRPPVVDATGWRSQLARAYAQYKQANKRH